MSFPEFRYMRWAKAHATHVGCHLGRSGLGPPAAAELGLGAVELALAGDGAEVVTTARHRVAARFGLEPAEVMLTLGASHAVYLACRTLLRPGDLVLVEQPAYEVLASLPALVGARVARFRRAPMADGHRLPADLAERIGAERPRLLVLTNPHNPTGATLAWPELGEVHRALRAVGARLLVDEVYLEFDADPPAASFAGRAADVLCASSLTKAYGLGALRFGWLAGAGALVAEAERFNDYVSVNYPTPSAALGLAALERLTELRARAAELRTRNLPLVERFVAARADVGWHPPATGVMCWLALPAVPDTRHFAERLLARTGTLVVPGEFFDAPGHVRVGFGVPTAELAAGLGHLGAALDEVTRTAQR